MGRSFFRDKKVLVMGLGRFGGGLDVVAVHGGGGGDDDDVHVFPAHEGFAIVGGFSLEASREGAGLVLERVAARDDLEPAVLGHVGVDGAQGTAADDGDIHE